jgi:hypothetical protein
MPSSLCYRQHTCMMRKGAFNKPDVDLDNRSLCQNTQVGVQRARTTYCQRRFMAWLVLKLDGSYGFFLTEMIGSFAVTPRLGTLMCANLWRSPMGRMNRSCLCRMSISSEHG